MSTSYPFARNKALRAELVKLKAAAEMNHFRRSDGTCAYVPPCPSCGVITEADKTIAFLDEERNR